jgi:ABC-type metal ion transport system substrate-binding protein
VSFLKLWSWKKIKKLIEVVPDVEANEENDFTDQRRWLKMLKQEQLLQE